MIPNRALLGLLGVLVLMDSSNALESAGSVVDVATIVDGEGNARILFHWSPAIDAEHFAIRRASLKFDLSGEAESRVLRFRVHPVTAEWTAADVAWSSGWAEAGGDFDSEIMSKADYDLAKGGGTVYLDVSQLLRTSLEEGSQSNSFLITADPEDGIGLKEGDLSRFDGLSSASLKVSWRKVPAKPIELQQDDNVDSD